MDDLFDNLAPLGLGLALVVLPVVGLFITMRENAKPPGRPPNIDLERVAYAFEAHLLGGEDDLTLVERTLNDDDDRAHILKTYIHLDETDTSVLGFKDRDGDDTYSTGDKVFFTIDIEPRTGSIVVCERKRENGFQFTRYFKHRMGTEAKAAPLVERMRQGYREKFGKNYERGLTPNSQRRSFEFKPGYFSEAMEQRRASR